MLFKILFIALFGAVVYFWNRFIIPMMIKQMVHMNPSNSGLKTNEETLIKGFQGFFWVAFIWIAFNQLFAL